MGISIVRSWFLLVILEIADSQVNEKKENDGYQQTG